MTTSSSLATAATDIGRTFEATGRQTDLMFYALLLIILMLLVFIFLKEWLNQRAMDRAAAGLREATAAVVGLHIIISRLESTNGQLLALLLKDKELP